MKIFGVDYDSIEPTKLGCACKVDGVTTSKSIEDIEARLEACQLEITERQKEKEYLKGLLTVNQFLNIA